MKNGEPEFQLVIRYTSGKIFMGRFYGKQIAYDEAARAAQVDVVKYVGLSSIKTGDLILEVLK